MKSARIVVLAAAALLLAANVARAQGPGDELRRTLVTRAELEELAIRLEQTAESRSLSASVRDRARGQAAAVRSRLRDGDFQVGDRVYLRVEGESALADTFSVRDGRVIVLPQIGTVSLAGVLRVELHDHLTRALAQYVRNPRVRAQSLIGVVVIGAVLAQGFYTVPVDNTIADVLASARGIAVNANLDEFRIERGAEILYDNGDLQQVATEGRTLDALGLQAGDRFVVPEKKVHNPYQTIQTLQILLTIPITVLGLIQVFKR